MIRQGVAMSADHLPRLLFGNDMASAGRALAQVPIDAFPIRGRRFVVHERRRE
jgi:hypothetical protein